MHEIQPILRHYPPDCQPSRPESLGSAGGLSGAEFWRLVAPRGALVLRRWPIEHPMPDGLRFIHAVLQHAHRHGMTILPVPLPTIAGETFVRHAGHLWELAPWLPGVADYERSPRIAKLCAAMTALAQFHVATTDFELASAARPNLPPPTAASNPPTNQTNTPPAVTRRLAWLREIQSGGIDSLTRAITDSTWPDLAPLARQFVAALPRAVPPAIARLAPLADVAMPLQPCIRDIWHDHVLFDGDRVTGLIDFGAMQIDTPATDIARMLGSLSDSPPLQGEGSGEGFDVTSNVWTLGLAAYSAVRPLADEEIKAAHALDAAGTILAGCNWLRWIYIDGRQFEKPQYVVDRFARLLKRINEL